MKIVLRLSIAIVATFLLNKNSLMASNGNFDEATIRATINFSIDAGLLNGNNSEEHKRDFALRLLDQQERDMNAHKQAQKDKQEEERKKDIPVYSYNFVVTSSPSVHELTERIDPRLLEETHYDLTKFAFICNLSPEVFTWDFETGTENETIRKILDKQFHIYEPLNELSKKISFQKPEFNKCLFDLVLLYQEIEAEGVFYRDLKRKLDATHAQLMGNKEYEATRTKNNQIVDAFFDIVETLANESRGRIEFALVLLNQQERRGKQLTTEQLIDWYKSFVYGNHNETGLIQKTRQALIDLRKKHGLPGLRGN